MLRIAAVLLFFSTMLSAQAQTPPTQSSPAAPAKSAVKKSAPPKGTPASRPTPPQANGPCIGVISLIGNRFGVKKIGFTVFGNDYKEITADDWKLDDLVVDRVRAVVGTGLAVRKVAHARGTLDSYQGGGLLKIDDPQSMALLGQVAGPVRCERYVVVARSAGQFSGNQHVVGVGIVNLGASLLSSSHVHAVVRINVHDGRTFKVLKSGQGSNSALGFLNGPPTRKLDGFTWPEAPEAVNTPEVRAAARALLVEVLDKSLPDLLAP